MYTIILLEDPSQLFFASFIGRCLQVFKRITAPSENSQEHTLGGVCIFSIAERQHGGSHFYELWATASVDFNKKLILIRKTKAVVQGCLETWNFYKLLKDFTKMFLMEFLFTSIFQVYLNFIYLAFHLSNMLK